MAGADPDPDPHRVAIIARVVDRRLTQAKAATLLGICRRQVRRLCQAYRQQGASGLESRRRGKPSNRRLPDELRERAIRIVRDEYVLLGPTRAHQQLRSIHGIHVARETLRTWMVAANIWQARSKLV